MYYLFKKNKTQNPTDWERLKRKQLLIAQLAWHDQLSLTVLMLNNFTKLIIRQGHCAIMKGQDKTRSLCIMYKQKYEHFS
jgi:hypothetical protein